MWTSRCRWSGVIIVGSILLAGMAGCMSAPAPVDGDEESLLAEEAVAASQLTLTLRPELPLPTDTVQPVANDTATPLPTITATPSQTPSASPSATATPSPTPSPTWTATPTPTTEPSPTRAPWQTSEGEWVTVVAVIDGDTIEVVRQGETARVQYIGVDTPEPDQPCGPEATAANAALVAGQQVWLEKDSSDTDTFGRLLRYVYAGDIFVNAELVRLGYGRSVRYPPDIRHNDYYEQLQANAPRPACMPPPLATLPASDGQPGAGVCDCAGPDLDCADLVTQDNAQTCYNYCLELGYGDVFYLDGDEDGVACASLP